MVHAFCMCAGMLSGEDDSVLVVASGFYMWTDTDTEVVLTRSCSKIRVWEVTWPRRRCIPVLQTIQNAFQAATRYRNRDHNAMSCLGIYWHR